MRSTKVVETSCILTVSLYWKRYERVLADALLRIVFGRSLVVLEQKIMFIINIILLGAGPIIVGALVLGLHSKGKLLWSRDGWFRFPLAFVVSMAAAIGLAVVYSKFNAYVSIHL